MLRVLDNEASSIERVGGMIPNKPLIDEDNESEI